jgi:hypothetical protein
MVTSSSDNYNIIKSCTKSPHWKSRWTNRDFSSVRLATQVMTYPQKCFRPTMQNCLFLWYLGFSRRWLSRILYSVMPWELVDVYPRFGGTYCLHLQGGTVSQASRANRAWKTRFRYGYVKETRENEEEQTTARITRALTRGSFCLRGLLFDPEDGGSAFLRNVTERLQDYTASHTRRQHCS